ncbi:uncharacterized protein LOC110624068 [Manihot esculenta]|uniref:uncharacterized protein LOC110624068 n=1 Tax=Manihot esculenta TaxID=3983 RepID=UPI000B5D1B93|nr:uncharacterized protein LOC110624068 [Manihot esculenta]
MMQLQDVNDFMLYRVFPFTLTDLAQKWYQHLNPDLLLIYFLKNSPDLWKNRQGEDESFRSFISCFKAKAIHVEELNHEIECEALKNETCNIKFMDSLIKNPVATYQQLMDKAQKYIRFDNEVQALREDKKLGQSKTQKLDKQSYESERSNPMSWSMNDRSKFRNYTPLNDSRTHILI